MYSLNNLDIQQFLSQYWQKKPLVIKQGFTNFIDPLDENNLAGLSQEPSIDSRIVSYSNNQWQVSHGPFDDVNEHCVGSWSLLVQSVDHFIPEADSLMRAFDFIPHWRMDDLMVSFSNKDAGVGSHLDQYDVFIVQGKGTRRWQVGLPGDFNTIRPHIDLSQISGFTPIIDQVLEPGDIIYIPANHPHNGVALEECANYSVGFRAPTQQEMLSSLADFAIDNNLFTKRYTDKALAPRQFSGEIKQAEILGFKHMLQQLLETEQFSSWVGNFLSESVNKQAFNDEDLPQFELEIVQQELLAGIEFIRSPGIKPVFVEQKSADPQEFKFYIQGESFSVPSAEKQMVINFLSEESFCNKNIEIDKSSIFFTKLLSTLINKGYWYIDE